ncbi:preprotein translocase subunit SecE [Paenibacillus hamazuiensis]|uniref:preprotein translocase subunit SecE n=1 Tax=Paenibacillus hamazuiensis TaxID=2936508 RepID=UPI00200F85BD
MSFLAKLKGSFSFFTDSFAELKKVKWPSRKELVSYTLVVLGTVIFVTIYFYILDLGISELLRLVFGR